MLPPEYLMSVADGVSAIYGQVEQDIIADIARRIVKAGYMTDTAKWQLKKGREFGYLQGNIDKILAKATGLSEKEIRRIMEESATKALEYDDEIYKAAGLDPLPVSKSPALTAMVLQGTDKTLALVGNYTQTTAQMSKTAYNNVLDKAYLQIISGAFDKNTAIKNAVKEVAANGIHKVAYPSGATTSIESAIRGAVLTGVNQSAAKLQIARAEEMNWRLVEVSSHPGARPEHAVWQGKIYSLDGAVDGYEDFYEATGYGTGPGLCGWNCYHSFYPYYAGISQPGFSHDPSADNGSTNDKDYRNMQKQRYYERRIREAKKECNTYNEAMKAATNDELKEQLYKEFQAASVKLKNREAALKKFLNETGGKRHAEREWAAGFDRSVSSKAVWANRKAKKGK